jgi:phosphinothricin acetyltransferase
MRPARAADVEAIASIYAHYVEHTFITFDLDAPSAEGWRARWQEAQTVGYPWVVAERAGAVVGFVTTGAFRPKAAYRSTVETTIYLAREATGQGIGRPLYELALRELAASGLFHLATAGIALPNAASVELHERLGFTRVGVFEEVGHKLGAWRDVGWWQRRL